MTDVLRSAPGQPSRVVLRPSSLTRNALDAARQSRIEAGPGEVLVRSPGSPARKVTGIAEVIHVPGDAQQPKERHLLEGELTIGTVRLLGTRGDVLLEFDVAPWFPEPVLGPISAGERAYTLTARLLADALGVPYRISAEVPEGPTAARVVPEPTRLNPLRLVPPLYLGAALSVATALIAFYVGGRDSGVGQVAMAVTAWLSVAVAVLMAARRVQTGLRLGRPVRLDRAFFPQPATPVPRGFLRRARLGSVGDELVLVDPAGAEQWLGGPGEPLGVSRVVVCGGDRGGPTHLELRTGDGLVLAHLPYAEWAGGDRGLDELAGFCRDAKLDLDRTARSRGIDVKIGTYSTARVVDHRVDLADGYNPVVAIPSVAPAVMAAVADSVGGGLLWAPTRYAAWAAIAMIAVPAVIRLAYRLYDTRTIAPPQPDSEARSR